MDSSRFDTVSLRALPQGKAIRRVLAAALAAVDPYAAVKRWLRREGDRLALGETAYDLARFRRVWLVGAGKAGFPMAQAAVEVLGERLSGGLVIVKEGHAPEGRGPEGQALSGVEIVQAGHPLPDRRGVEATRRLAGILREAGEDDLVVCLISGGGSALMTAPAEGISLDELQQLTSALLACGATINQINCLRKHVDLVKGGGLARLAAPAALATLVLSDVVGDPLDVIASGPASPDESTFAEAWGVLELYGLQERVPLAIRARLQAGMRGELPETPKPGDPLFERVQNQVVSSNVQAAQAALDQARAEGWNALLLTTFLQGEARQAGRMLAAVARQAAASGRAGEKAGLHPGRRGDHCHPAWQRVGRAQPGAGPGRRGRVGGAARRDAGCPGHRRRRRSHRRGRRGGHRRDAVARAPARAGSRRSPGAQRCLSFLRAPRRPAAPRPHPDQRQRPGIYLRTVRSVVQGESTR